MSLLIGRCIVGLAVWVGLGGVAVGDSRVDEFMADDGRLRAELRVHDGQHGMVGETGTLWVIEPSGAYQVSSFVNHKGGPPEREGNLTAEQLDLVAQTLANEGFADLPRRIGEGAAPNTRVISVAFGRDTATLMLPPGPPVELERLIALHACEPGPRGRLLALVDTVLEVTAAD